MKLYKQLSKSGTVTIPQQVRHELNIPKGAAIEVETMDEEVIIRKHVPTCMKCGTAENVIVSDRIELCDKCLKKMQEVAHDTK